MKLLCINEQTNLIDTIIEAEDYVTCLLEAQSRHGHEFKTHLFVEEEFCDMELKDLPMSDICTEIVIN